MKHRLNWTAIIIALMMIGAAVGMFYQAHSWSKTSVDAQESPVMSPTETSTSKKDNVAGDTGTMPQPVSTFQVGTWNVQQMRDLGKNPIVVSWIKRLKAPAPAQWKTFPNVDNKAVGFSRHDGLEYGEDVAPFCEQDEYCNFPVQGRGYRLITADYRFLDLSCKAGKEHSGCLLMIINVNDNAVSFKDQVAVDGFTVAGRYWNGDKLDLATWGIVSHASANMLNMPTSAHPNESLNFGMSGVNAGANCGNINGCNSVKATVVIVTGTDVLAVLQTTVAR